MKWHNFEKLLLLLLFFFFKLTLFSPKIAIKLKYINEYCIDEQKNAAYQFLVKCDKDRFKTIELDSDVQNIIIQDLCRIAS